MKNVHFDFSYYAQKITSFEANKINLKRKSSSDYAEAQLEELLSERSQPGILNKFKKRKRSFVLDEKVSSEDEFKKRPAIVNPDFSGKINWLKNIDVGTSH